MPGRTRNTDPCCSSRTWRLRFTVIDQPGCLAAAATALADLGVDILRLDVQVVSATEVIDEATVLLPAWLDVPAVEHALRSAGATAVWAVPIPVRQLEDIATRSLRLAAGVVAVGADDRSLCDAIAHVVDAELVYLTRADSTSTHDGATYMTSAGPTCFERQHVEGLPSRGGAWTMAVPDDRTDLRRVVVAARRGSPFTAIEAARALALLQVCVAGAVRQPEVATESRSPKSACDGARQPEDVHVTAPTDGH